MPCLIFIDKSETFFYLIIIRNDKQRDMKNILIIALTLIAFTSAHAQSPATQEASKATISAQVATQSDVQAPIAAPVQNNVTPAAPTAGSAPDNSAKFVGTNDLNLFLLRDGIKKA